MINCDEGTLAYCAAKIASEIEQDPAWKSAHLDIIAIDLWDELADIGESARQIANDRETTERLERGRLCDDPEVRAMIEADKQQGMKVSRCWRPGSMRSLITGIGRTAAGWPQCGKVARLGAR